MQAVQAQGASLEAVRQMVSGLREMFAGMQSGENLGTICIPVYVGGTLLDEVVVKDTSFKGLWKVSFTLREF